MISKYFWDLNEVALQETKKTLHDPNHPQFLKRMTTLLSRCDSPKELFRVLPKGQFIEAWPKIRSYWIKTMRHSEQRDWWETLHEQLLEKAGEKSTNAKGEPSLVFRKFGDTMKERRMEMGLSQQQLGQRTGLKQPIISQIEDGKKNITFFTLIRLGKALGLKTIDI